MNEELVSAIIPTYNHARFVGEAVESALNQTYENVEVIVIDDGSADDTHARLTPYLDRIEYVYQENRGLPAARNTGIRQAKGAWIAFLDADDVWHPQKTAIQLAGISQFEGAAVVGSPSMDPMPETLTSNCSARQLRVVDFLVSTPISPSSTMVRRQCFDHVGLFDETLTSVEDRDMWLRLVAQYPTYQVLSPCWCYRRHEGQMSRKAHRMLDNYRRVLEKFFDQHRECRPLRRLAYGYMHVDAAYCFYEEGSRQQAMLHLLESFLWHFGPVSNRGRLFRLKLLARFVLGEQCIRRATQLRHTSFLARMTTLVSTNVQIMEANSRRSNGSLCRVAHVSLGLEMGGMEKLLVEFARHADRERFQLHFVCLEGRGKLAGQIEALGWPIDAMGKPPGLRPGLILKLARLFRRLGVHVVHTHNEPACLYGVPAARLARVPLVLNTRHGQGSPPGEPAGHRRSNGRRGSPAESFACRRTRPPCRFRSGLSADRVTTVWNGIDTEKFPFRGPCPSGPAIVVARLAEVKNIAALIRAVPLVVDSVPCFTLRIVGDGPCRAAIEALTAELGLQTHVAFTGEANDVPQQLGQASMFVLPSLSEGVSLSLLEAMATGLPVVATSVGGNVEVVVDGITGILVPLEEPAKLAQAIIRLAADPELSRRMGAAGRRRVETAFDVGAMVRAYEDLYQDGMLRQ